MIEPKNVKKNNFPKYPQLHAFVYTPLQTKNIEELPNMETVKLF